MALSAGGRDEHRIARELARDDGRRFTDGQVPFLTVPSSERAEQLERHIDQGTSEVEEEEIRDADVTFKDELDNVVEQNTETRQYLRAALDELVREQTARGAQFSAGGTEQVSPADLDALRSMRSWICPPVADCSVSGCMILAIRNAAASA